MGDKKAHPGVRKLRICLYRQLKLLRKGLVDEALFLFPHVESLIRELSKESISDGISLEILKECSKMNDEVLIRLDTEKNALQKGIFLTEVERKIKDFLS